MKLLLTAFEPFGGEILNPAQEVAMLIEQRGVKTVFLPVEYDKAREIAVNEIKLYRPDIVVSLGQAGGREGISIEKYAVNKRRASIPDNGGRLISIEEPIEPGAPERFECAFDVEAVVDTVKAMGYPCYASESAGTFICNEVFYGCCRVHPRAVFVHLPFSTEQAARHEGAFTMRPADMADAVKMILDSLREQTYA